MKKPFLRALSAVAYITALVLIISSFESKLPKEDTLLAPILMLSLLVFSVAVMGFLFFYDPLRLYIDNQKKEAVHFFLKTIGILAIFIIIFVLGLFLGF
jgi:Na+/serine symporter